MPIDRALSSHGLRRALPALLLTVLAIAAIAALWWKLPAVEWLRAATSWVRGSGPSGMAMFVLIGVLWHLALAPASLFYVAAGLIYGGVAGFGLAIGTAIGASAIAFLLARSLARQSVAARLDGRARLEALDQAVRDEGWRIVLMLRVSPMLSGPVQTYLFGLTRVSLVGFLAGTSLGAAPWVAFFCWLGSAGSAALRTGDDALGLEEWAMIAGSLALVGLVAWLLTRRAKAYLESHDLDA